MAVAGLHWAPATWGVASIPRPIRRGQLSHQQAAGKFSDFRPLPCGIDRYSNPVLANEAAPLMAEPRLPRRSRRLLRASQWQAMSETSLMRAILTLAGQERSAIGPARVRIRRKRWRAVELFRQRFASAPALDEFSMYVLPRLGTTRR
jgi:hypothetical protein